jgi:tetratricopeptide (TPR) repeat protein
MRKLLQEIGDRLQAFINQRDNLALVLTSPATDSLPILKILEGLEEMNPSDFFWTFTDNFTDPTVYANTVVTGFANKHELIRLAMEKEGMIPWPALPTQVLAENTLPGERLRQLAAFPRELLPIPNAGSVIWVFYPLEIANHPAFATLMEEVLRHDFPFPWCHHLRFMIREDPADRALHRVLATSPRIQWYEPDLGTDAISRSMEAEIADTELPLEERLNTLMVMALTDCAHKRFPQALEKYELLLQYHAPMGNHPMAALALNGIGEVYEKIGDLDRANESYEAALIPASNGDSPPIPVLLNAVLNLANLRRTQKRWEDAEAYFDLAQQLATVNRDASLKIRSLENRGTCQREQGKLEEASKSWNDALVMAAQLQDVELCRSLLERLHGHYTETRQITKEREVREQLAAFAK